MKRENNSANSSDASEQALAYIKLSIEKDLVVHIKDRFSARQAWQMLRGMYAEQNKVSCLCLTDGLPYFARSSVKWRLI